MREQHPLAWQTVEVHFKKPGIQGDMGVENVLLIDWWINVSGGYSWRNCVGVPVCTQYAGRAGSTELPYDDEVLYGRVGETEYLIHISEIGEPIEALHSPLERTSRVIELLKPLNDLLIDAVGDSEFTRIAYCQIKAAAENLEKHKEQVK